MPALFALQDMLSVSLILGAHAATALQAHPDKGGDVNAFNRIRVAYSKLSATVAEIELKATCFELEYEAIIQKVELPSGWSACAPGSDIVMKHTSHHLLHRITCWHHMESLPLTLT